jgi:hypothetical protein
VQVKIVALLRVRPEGVKRMTDKGSEWGDSPVSEEIGGALREAVGRLDRIDADPLIRQAVVKVTMRHFSRLLAETFPAYRSEIAAEMLGLARAVREGTEATLVRGLAAAPADAAPMATAQLVRDTGRDIRDDDAAAAATTAGGDKNARDPEPSREAGGRGQADPQGSRSDDRTGKGPRHHGSERFGKIDSILRVGGA